MKSETYVVGSATLVFGLLVGIVIGRYGFDSGKGAGPRPGPSGQAPTNWARTPGVTGGASSTGGATRVADFQAITALQDRVRSNSGDLAAWVELGHRYFDVGQAEKAIDAYDQALQLQPNDADVLTDQGVMYRRTKQFEKALTNFARAREVDPAHQASLYNIGVVNLYDLKDTAKAQAAWSEYARRNPNDPKSQFIRTELQRLGVGLVPTSGVTTPGANAAGGAVPSGAVFPGQPGQPGAPGGPAPTDGAGGVGGAGG